jgi:hypothetical protein
MDLPDEHFREKEPESPCFQAGDEWLPPSSAFSSVRENVREHVCVGWFCHCWLFIPSIPSDSLRAEPNGQALPWSVGMCVA